MAKVTAVFKNGSKKIDKKKGKKCEQKFKIIILASGYPRQKYNKQNHTHITANKSNKQYKQRNRGLEQ